MDLKFRSLPMTKPIRLYQDQNKKLYLIVGEEGKAETLYQKVERLSLYEFRQLLNDIKQNVLVNFGALGIEKASNTSEAEGTLLANDTVSFVSEFKLDTNLNDVDYSTIKDFFNQDNPYNDEYTVTNRKAQNQRQPNQASQNQDPSVNAPDATIPLPNPVDNPLLDPENVDTVEAQTKTDTKVDSKPKTK